MTKPGSVKEPKDGRRAAILRSAWKMMCRYGYGKTTVQEIASEAGIAKGTVYLYFKSKEDILVTLISETNRRVLERMEHIAQSPLPEPAKLERMLLYRTLEIYDVVRANPHGEEIIASHKPAIVKSLGWFFKRQKTLYERVISEGVKKGVFREKSPRLAADVLSTLSELLTPPYYRLTKRKDVENFARNLLKRFIAGISPDGKGNARGAKRRAR
jgi:TetR/AcrR family fatty acid metabolism transcriptional regulator